MRKKTVLVTLFCCLPFVFVSCDDPSETQEGIICPGDGLVAGKCGCSKEDGKRITDIIDISTGRLYCGEIVDLCPFDDKKVSPGICGCGLSDDKNESGEAWCAGLDLCPDDPLKDRPGICGCGVSDDQIDENTKLPVCLSTQIDLCPDDAEKVVPGVCGCGVRDDDIDPYFNIPRCIAEKVDLCPHSDKTAPGVCGCDVVDVDSDGDGIMDCIDVCPSDPSKTDSQGICGCGVPESDENIRDDDGDTYANCIDICPDNAYKWADDSCYDEKGKTDCSRIFTVFETKPLCAHIIASGQDLIRMRDAWNQGVYSSDSTTSDDTVFLLVENIDIGDSIENSIDWVGIGTEDHPFNGTFLGQYKGIQHTISATSGSLPITLGSEEVDNVGLFGVVSYGSGNSSLSSSSTTIDGINVDLSVVGRNNVGILAGRVDNLNVSHVLASGSATGIDHVGGLVGSSSRSSFESVAANARVRGSGQAIGGLIGYASNWTSVVKSYVTGSSAMITASEGASRIGGFIGEANDTSINNAYASGELSGYRQSGGFIGLIDGASKILNVYALTEMTCNEAPCAGFSGQISGNSTLKNAYATGHVVNLIPAKVDPPTPEPDDPDDPNPKDGETSSNDDGNNPENPGESNENDQTGDKTESGDPLEDHDCSSVDVAMLIASVCGNSNVLSDLYYWQNSDDTIAAPESILNNLTPFTYLLNVASINADRRLNDKLNSNLSCTSNVCKIDDTACDRWNTTSYRIDGKSMTIPALTYLKTTY